MLALVLSVTLSLMTYELTRRYLLSKRETLATEQAITSANATARFLKDRTADPTVILATLSSATGSRAVLQVGGRWFATAVDVGPNIIPAPMQALKGTRTERQRVTFGGNPAVIVAVPIGPDVGVYYEVSPLTELRSTLRTLAFILAITAAITTLFGAVVGCLREPTRPPPDQQHGPNRGRVSRAESATPVWRAPTPTSHRSCIPSTTWSTRSKNASTARLGSRPTSVTSSVPP